MHSSNVARIYNLQPDPLERGPPKRVAREEQHIGELVAASKKRISWRFTLGESDRTHEVVLVHSIMSYKKVRNGDERHMFCGAEVDAYLITTFDDVVDAIQRPPDTFLLDGKLIA